MSSQRIFAIVIRNLYMWPRTLERLMGSFGWPFFDLVIWGLTMTFIQKSLSAQFSLMTFILGSLIFWTIVWRVQNDVSVNFLDEAWNKNLINIFSSPLTPGEFLLAMIVLSLVKLCLTVITLTVGAWILYQFNFLKAFGFYIPVLIINLLLFGWAFGFLVNGFILRFGYTVSEFAWALIAFVQPLSSLPSWAQKIGQILPTTYVFEEMRRILFSGQIEWKNLLISFLLNILYLILSLGFFQWMYESAREHGRLVKLN